MRTFLRPYAPFVKLCDRLANIKYSKESGSIMFNVYKEEYYLFKDKLAAVTNAYHDMWKEMEELLEL